jgi:hypothetical protein
VATSRGGSRERKSDSNPSPPGLSAGRGSMKRDVAAVTPR